MQLLFTLEVTADLFTKLSFVNDHDSEKDDFFAERSYGMSIEALYISFACISKEFEEFFKPRAPRYILGGKRNIEGTEVIYKPHSFMYDIMLNHDVFRNTQQPKPLLASEILKSLFIISNAKQIKDFDVTRFKSDLEFYFKMVQWI